MTRKASSRRRKKKTGSHISHYLASVVALCWNGAGLTYWSTRRFPDEEGFMALSLTEQQFLSHMPGWAWSACAVACLFGTAGAAMLLLRLKAALPLSLWAFLGASVYLVYPVVQRAAMAGEELTLLYLPFMALLMESAQLLYAGQLRRRKFLR